MFIVPVFAVLVTLIPAMMASVLVKVTEVLLPVLPACTTTSVNSFISVTDCQQCVVIPLRLRRVTLFMCSDEWDTHMIMNQLFQLRLCECEYTPVPIKMPCVLSVGINGT